MTAPDVRTAAQAEAGARVIHVTVVRQTADTSEVIRHYCRVEPCLPTREQIAGVIARSLDPEYGIVDDVDLIAADAVLELMRDQQDGGE